MYKLTAAAVGALLAAACLMGAQPAAAQTARACTAECVSGNWNFLASPSWSQAWWTKNNGGWYVRSFIHCQNGRSYETSTGGWVTPLNFDSRATCNSGYVGVGAGYDWKTCSSCSYSRHWITGRRQ